VVEPESDVKGGVVGGAHGPIDAGIGVVGVAEDGVIEVSGLVGGRGAEAERAEDFFEIVIVGDAEDRGHEKLPDHEQQNERAEGEVDMCAPMDCQSHYVIYLHLPENGYEENR